MLTIILYRSGLLNALATQDMIRGDVAKIREDFRLHRMMMDETTLSMPEHERRTKLLLIKSRQEEARCYSIFECDRL